MDVNSEVLTKAQKSISNNLGRVAKKLYKDKPQDGEKFVADALSRIKTSSDPTAAVKDVDLVVEAIVENLSIKHDIFKKLDAVILFANLDSWLSVLKASVKLAPCEI